MTARPCDIARARQTVEEVLAAGASPWESAALGLAWLALAHREIEAATEAEQKPEAPRNVHPFVA